MTTRSPTEASSCPGGASSVTRMYGIRPGEPNVGLKLHAEEVGKGIAEREQGESVAYGVLDPSAFKEDGGPSIAERIARGSGGKVWFRHADNTRVRRAAPWAAGIRSAPAWWATATGDR